jgi:hypothetical protein
MNWALKHVKPSPGTHASSVPGLRMRTFKDSRLGTHASSVLGCG